MFSDQLGFKLLDFYLFNTLLRAVFTIEGSGAILKELFLPVIENLRLKLVFITQGDSYFNGSSWEAPRLVSSNKPSEPKIIVSGNSVNIFWLENESTSTPQVKTKKFDLISKTFEENVNVADLNRPNYDVVLSGSTLHVVYTYYSLFQRIGYVYNDGSGWSQQQELIQGFANNYFAISVTADTQGGLHLSGATYGPEPDYSKIIFYSSLKDGIWYEPETAFLTTKEITKVHINVDATGAPNVLFNSQNSDTVWTVNYIQRKGLDSWTAPSTAIYKSQTTTAFNSSINSTKSKLLVTYQAYTSGHDEVFVTTADLLQDVISPGISVSGITAGQILNAETTLPISWTTTDDKGVSSVVLQYSTDGGTTFSLIASGLASTGTYQWPVPKIATSTALIIATAVDGGGNQAAIQSPLFTINYAPVYPLTVLKNGTGSGTITGSSAINCGVTCTDQFTTPTQVTLTATADNFSVFSGWSGACTGTGSCDVTVNAAKTVTATFADNSRMLVAMLTGTGTGGITSSPAAVTCSLGTCLARVISGSSLILNPVAEPGSVFTGWSGACSGTGNCHLTMSSDKSVIANFVQQVTVTAQTTAGGTITPASQTGNPGLVATLTVTPNTGNAIASVTGCGGTLSGNTYTTAPVNATCTVTAEFKNPAETAAAQGLYRVSYQGKSLYAKGAEVLTLMGASNDQIFLDGNGGCTWTTDGLFFQEGSTNVDVSPDVDTWTCSYTVVDGAIAFVFPDEPIMQGRLSADGNLLLINSAGITSDDSGMGTEYGSDQFIGLKAGTGLSAASLNGTYVTVGQKSSLEVTSAANVNESIGHSLGSFVLDGLGNGTQTGTWTNLQSEGTTVQIDSGPELESFTYTVTSTGEVTMTFADKSTVTGYVDATGQVFTLTFAEVDQQNNDYRTFQVVGVKQGSNQSLASLNGDYRFGTQEFGFGQDNGGIGRRIDSSNGTLTFNGVGGCSVQVDNGVDFADRGTRVDSYPEDPFTAPCTYTITPQGEFFVDFGNGEGIQGVLSADKKSLLFGELLSIAEPGYSYYGTTQMFGVKKAMAAILDTIVPTVTGFTLPSTSISLNVAINIFTVSDNVGVTGYCLVATNSSSACTWSATAPSSYPFTTDGNKILYAFAKDAAGNISDSMSATTTITLPDTTAPTVTAFTLPLTSTSLIVAINSFIASDVVGVSGYCLAENDSYSDCTWSPTAPGSYEFTTAGNKTLYAFAKDAAGNISSSKNATTMIAPLDTTAPELLISTLPDGARTNNATLNVSGTLSDASGIDTLTINTVPVNVSNGSFSYAFTLLTGDNLITINATDTLGNSTTVTRTITLDLTAPTLTVTAPSDNSKTAQTLAGLTGTISELSTVSVTLNSGAPLNATLEGNAYSAVVNLVSGLNSITVIATDLAGNSTSVVRSVTYDNDNPSLAITDPGQDVSIGQETLTISGTASDALTRVSVTVTFNGQIYPQVIENGTFSQQLTMPALGTYLITATATDEVGNSSNVTRNIIYAPVDSFVGDLDKDGQVTVADALRVLQISIGFVSASDDDLLRGDVAPFVNGKPAPDGKLDVGDALLLLLRRSVDLVTW